MVLDGFHETKTEADLRPITVMMNRAANQSRFAAKLGFR